MTRHLRHDRSDLLFPSPTAQMLPERRQRCLAIAHLRNARREYHSLADAGPFADAAGEQLRWKLRELAAGIGLRLVISGVPAEPRGVGELN